MLLALRTFEKIGLNRVNTSKFNIHLSNSKNANKGKGFKYQQLPKKRGKTMHRHRLL